MLTSCNKNPPDTFHWNDFIPVFLWIIISNYWRMACPMYQRIQLILISNAKNKEPDKKKISCLQESVIFNLSKCVFVNVCPLRVHSSCQDALLGLVEDPDSRSCSTQAQRWWDIQPLDKRSMGQKQIAIERQRAAERWLKPMQLLLFFREPSREASFKRLILLMCAIMRCARWGRGGVRRHHFFNYSCSWDMDDGPSRLGLDSWNLATGTRHWLKVPSAGQLR